MGATGKIKAPTLQKGGASEPLKSQDVDSKDCSEPNNLFSTAYELKRIRHRDKRYKKLKRDLERRACGRAYFLWLAAANRK